MTFTALCPLDGRYAQRVSALGNCMGESSLAAARVRAECAYLEVLCSLGLPNLPTLSAKEKQLLNTLPCLNQADLQILSEYENTGRHATSATRHDVKAIEYFMKEKLSAAGFSLRREWVHFALTSEDINSTAYALLLSDGLSAVLLPFLTQIYKQLDRLARKEASSILLARTHGQPAVPTTFGKEIRVYAARLKRQLDHLNKTQISCKWGGAVGNYNAFVVAFPRVNPIKTAQKVVSALNKGRKIKLFLSPYSTQVDPRDSYAELFDNLRRIHLILLDLCQDLWLYISAGLVKQKVHAGEVGSSAMPQKINPIDFENAEGNLGLCNALLEFFSRKLPCSRLQRDLSDSTVLRNMGLAFGYALVAYTSVLEGLSRAQFDRAAAQKEVDNHPEVLAEAVQTILRASGETAPYEQVKTFIRGHVRSTQEWADFINQLKINPSVRRSLLALTPRGYIGLARAMAQGK